MTKKQRKDRNHIFNDIENLDNPNSVRVINQHGRSSSSPKASSIKSTSVLYSTASPQNRKLKLRASSDSRGENEYIKQLQTNAVKLQPIENPTVHQSTLKIKQNSPQINQTAPSKYRASKMIPLKTN